MKVDLDLLEKNFQDIVLKPEIARFSSKGPQPMSLTKNWYSRPTPPDLQFEEKVFQSQSSYSADKVYEWNIDGFSEQEIMNTMSKMSLISNAYVNNNIRQPDIVKILTQGFSGVLRNWWDKLLSRYAKETIQNAVKRNDEGFPIFDETIGSAQSDGVNTLIYTILKHFIGTPSDITSRISDQLNNLRCHQMSDYRWYQDVFISKVMLRDDSQKPYWKEKFIDGLPRLFAYKVKEQLTVAGSLNYDAYTYGDICAVIKKLGISMCNDQIMLREEMRNSKKAKYEMGTFCEQFGLPAIAPSKRKHKFSKPHGSLRRKPHDEFYKKTYKKPFSKPFSKKKKSKDSSQGKCYICGNPGHFANKCPKKAKKDKKI